ncbi:MAG: hypothetical protein JWO55_839 [Candidatus Saccharibacteria bacterium]|jgi:hypothetical protein|nr:hypothetical protein [Candidatus Saccharibacteria bacterium]
MNPQQQAILARDMIDMIQKYADNPDILAYLESFSSSLVYILEGVSTVNWADLAGVCDQRYYSLKHGTPLPLNSDMLAKVQQSIAPDLPNTTDSN